MIIKIRNFISKWVHQHRLMRLWGVAFFEWCSPFMSLSSLFCKKTPFLTNASFTWLNHQHMIQLRYNIHFYINTIFNIVVIKLSNIPTNVRVDVSNFTLTFVINAIFLKTAFELISRNFLYRTDYRTDHCFVNYRKRIPVLDLYYNFISKLQRASVILYMTEIIELLYFFYNKTIANIAFGCSNICAIKSIIQIGQ